MILHTDKNHADVPSTFWPGKREFCPKVKSRNVQPKFRLLDADIRADIYDAAPTN